MEQSFVLFLFVKIRNIEYLFQVFMLNGYENLDQFREVEEQDLDSLGIKDPDTRSRLLAAVTSMLEYEQSCMSIVGQVSESSVTNNTSSSSRDSGCFTDTKVTNLAPDGEESNVDGRQSSPSTDNSSGYQTRGNYNIPLSGEISSTLQEVPDTTLDSSSSTDDAPMSRSKKYTGVLDSNKSCRFTSGASKPKLEQREPDSYRATLATVRPATPELSEQELDEETIVEIRQKTEQTGSKTNNERTSCDTGVSIHSERSSVTEEPPGLDRTQ